MKITITKLKVPLTHFLSTNKSLILPLITILLFWLGFFNWTGYHQLSIERNIFNGEIHVDTTAGPNLSWPWVQVANIDTRPRKLCVDCNCKTLNCRLVQIKKNNIIKLVENEGFKYFWLQNRISFNISAEQEYRGFDYTLRGYAFTEDTPNFIEIKKW